MKDLIFNVIHPLIGAGVIADHWYGISEAGNIAIAALWIIILLTFLVVAIGDNEDLKKAKNTKNKKCINRLFFASNVLILFAAGWFVSGFFFLIAWASMWLKRFNASNEDAKET